MHFNTILKHTIAWKMINTVLVFLINLLLVRLLGVAASGVFFYTITELSLLVLLLSWCLESGITYFASKDSHIISTILFVVLPLLLLQGLIATVVLRYLQLTFSYPLALLFIISNLAIIYFSAFFYARKWFVSLNVIICGVNFITALGLLFLWYQNREASDKAGFYQLIYIAAIALLAAILVVAILISTKKNAKADQPFLPVVKELFTYSSVAFVSNTLFFFVIRIDYFFVQQYCSSVALSNYIQVSKFGQLLILVPSIIGSLVFPYSAGSGDAMDVKKVQQLCRAITLIFVPVTLVIVLSGYWILPWVFGDGFNLMYVALLLYLPGFFALSIVTVLAAHLGGKRMLKANLMAALLALVVVVTADILAIPSFGINAAAAASSVGYMACCVYLVRLFKMKFNCSAKAFFMIEKQEIKYMATWCRKSIFTIHIQNNLSIKSKIQWGVTWLAMGMLKRSLKYRISGEAAGWLQPIPAKNISIFNRVDFILAQCRDKKILHIGFTDYPFTMQKINDGILLHLQVKKVTKLLLGLDNSSVALDQYRSATGDENIIAGDITDHYPREALDFNPELILLSEVLEHLVNPAKAVDILYDSFGDGTRVLVTVPNYAGLDSLASSLHQTEGIHPDHHWYFSPYTLCKLFDDKRFQLEQLHFGMYYLQHTIINPILKQYPFNGDCIMALFTITKNGTI